MGVFFYVGSLFSPRGCHFSVCERGGGVGLLSAWGSGGGGWIIGLAPHNNFCEILLLSHFLLHRFYNLSRSWRFEFFEGVIRSTKKTSPIAPPPPPAPTKISNFCPPPSHGQHFRFSHYYHYPITHTPGPACSLRNNINMLKSRPPSLNAPPPPKKRKK